LKNQYKYAQDKTRIRSTKDLHTEDTNNKQYSKGKVRGKKGVFVVVITIILVFIIAQVLYYYVIPRVNIDLKTVYHEATGGGGTGGLINVNTKVVNSGTVEARDFQMTLSVYNSTEVLLINKTYSNDILSPGKEYELKVVTNGNSYEDFYITLEVEFTTSDNDYFERYNYKTYEDPMNIDFEDSIFKWGA
jgi:hypothetical protein